MTSENSDESKARRNPNEFNWPVRWSALQSGLVAAGCATLFAIASRWGRAASIPAMAGWGILSIGVGIAVGAVWHARKIISQSDRAKQQLATAARENEGLQAELAEARQAADEANRAKKGFLANISHEIRTPMNGLMGMLELALNAHPNPDQESCLQMARSSADSLFRVVNDLLDFSKIESGRLRLDAVDFDLRVSLLDVLAAFKSSAERKGIKLIHSISSDIPQFLVGDPTRLRQALRHIVENAIKFTEQGEIEIGLDCEPNSESSINLVLSVRDTGIGISPHQLQRIFQPFEQGDGSSTRRYGGMGLGIAIAAELARSMEGRMWVESELGKGSTFYFRVRLELSSRNAAHKAPDASALVGVRILIFDNRAINRHTLSHAVVDWGMRPFPVSTGGAVLSGLKEAAAAGDPFPLVLMDSEMSDMDSFALSEQIRDNTHCNAPAILILASAGLRGDAARCRGLGIAAYLTTPIRRSQLRDALVTALESRTLEGRKPPLITRHTLREDQPLRILVAEDNPVNQILLVRFLAQYGHTVTTVNDGEQAVAELEKKPVDVILMDLQMPKLDGFAATAKIRQREDASGQHTPIIAVTANVVPGEMQHCKEIGMDGYIAKPLCVPELLHTIGRLANSMKSPAPQDAVTASLAQHDEEAVSVFLSDTPGKIAELRRAWEQSDFEAVRGLAHYLKGSAQYLGERRMNHLCDEVRACSTAGKAGEMGELLVGVEEEFARIEEGALWRKGANSWEE